MPLLTREFRQTAGIFTRNFFRELYDRLKTPFTLVFDNYQEVPAESDLNQIMPLAFAELPHEGHVIVISRDEPPSNFAKLRADRAMELVEYPELRFTEQETRQLIGKFVTQKLPKSTIDELYKNTEGWAAGLVLSLDQMQHQEKASQSAIGSSGVVFDYFAEKSLNAPIGEPKKSFARRPFCQGFPRPWQGDYLDGPTHARSSPDFTGKTSSPSNCLALSQPMSSIRCFEHFCCHGRKQYSRRCDSRRFVGNLRSFCSMQERQKRR